MNCVDLGVLITFCLHKIRYLETFLGGLLVSRRGLSMSVYQQTFHPNYNRQPYQQSVPVPQQYPYQQPSSLVYNDPNVFRRDFAARLSELTVNNKNMIHGLSFIAHDNARFGDIVVQCLEAHIRRVSH